jgi:DNA-binding ferritin-like protein
MEQIEEPDPVTADILHAVVEGLEKHLWMLRVQGM